jgi:hypothetical protein
MRGTRDESGVREVVYARDNAGYTEILAGLEPLFIRLAMTLLRPGERILDAFAYHADYLDLTNPFRPRPRVRPALLCLTKGRLVEVYAARGGLAAVPSRAWVVRHAADVEFGTLDLTEVTAVVTRCAVRRLGVARDVVLELHDSRRYRIGPHSDPARAEIIADRVRHRCRGPVNR